jgi:hypothetical protein
MFFILFKRFHSRAYKTIIVDLKKFKKIA